MLLFCIAINDVIEQLSKEGYIVVAYADDIIIGHRKDVSPQSVIDRVQ